VFWFSGQAIPAAHDSTVDTCLQNNNYRSRVWGAFSLVQYGRINGIRWTRRCSRVGESFCSCGN